MGKISGRPDREELKQKRRDSKKAEKELRERINKLHPKLVTNNMPNRMSKLRTVEEEIQERHTVVGESAKVYKINFKVLLNRLSRIPDPRNPQKIKHKLTVIMLYGILTFVYQMASRRDANRKMTAPIIMENLKELFPELESIPHNDTLCRLLSQINIEEIEAAQIEMIRRLIEKKKFVRYLINGRYPIAVDGTQKLARSYLWSEECLERKVRDKKKNEKEQESPKEYYVYVLEASLAFQNGMTIPLMSEFLSYTEGYTESNKQDCELKAFKRLAKRLKEEFPKLSILILIDGLYPNGPIFSLCRKHGWDFMIVWQDGNLKSVWEEFDGLFKICRNQSILKWGGRKQRFKWVNEIHYYYDKDQMEIVHAVVCEEEWEELDKASGRIMNKKSRHAWISAKPLRKENLHERCNLGARHRWNIETGIQVEKHDGYQYEHCFSYNWNAMKGYHYLMRIGHALNVLVQYSESLVEFIKDMGKKGFIGYIFESIRASLLDKVWLKNMKAEAFQLRLL